MLRAILVSLVFIASCLPSLAEAYLRLPIPQVPMLVSSTPAPPPIDNTGPILPGADVTRPSSYLAAGIDGMHFATAITPGVITTLYDRSVAISAINWFPASPAGSQQLALVFDKPVFADGCDVILHSRGTPALAGVRFQHQDAYGNWSEWTQPLGNFDTSKSGNKSWSGRCGIPETGTIIKALRAAPIDTLAGEVWFREFRVSLNGVSAP